MGRIISLFSRIIALSAACAVLLAGAAVVLGRALPDPGQAVFLARVGSASRIITIDSVRGVRVRLFPAPPYLSADLPRLSPDGQRVVYEILDENGMALIAYDSARRSLYRTAEGVQDRLASWSPDGKQLAFWSNRASPNLRSRRWQNWNFYILSVDDGAIRAITDDLSILPFGVPLWSPDGRQILLNYWRAGVGSSLYRVDVAAGLLTRVTGAIETGSDLGWSHDGARVIFRSNPGGNNEVLIMEMATGALTNLTGNPANDFDPAWSHDGARISFTSTRGVTLVRGARAAGDIYVADADGGGVRRLTEGGAWRPMWSADSAQLAFLSARAGRPAYYVIDSDGGEVRYLADAGRYTLLGWLAH